MKKLTFFIILLSIFSACSDTSETSSLPQGSVPTTTSEVLQESDVKLLDPLPLIAIRVGEAEQPMVLISKPSGNGFLLGERKGYIKAVEVTDAGSLSVGETLLDLSGAVSTAHWTSRAVFHQHSKPLSRLRSQLLYSLFFHLRENRFR